MDAALSVAVKPLRDRLMVLFEKSDTAYTDEQLIDMYREAMRLWRWPAATDSGIRSRRRELVDDGLLIDTGMVGKTLTGRASIKWGLPGRMF
jgi:hypothetical protein